MINHYNGEKTSDNAVLQAVKCAPRIVHRNATKQIAPAHPCPQPFAKPASAMLVHVRKFILRVQNINSAWWRKICRWVQGAGGLLMPNSQFSNLPGINSREIDGRIYRSEIICCYYRTTVDECQRIAPPYPPRTHWITLWVNKCKPSYSISFRRHTEAKNS